LGLYVTVLVVLELWYQKSINVIAVKGKNVRKFNDFFH